MDEILKVQIINSGISISNILSIFTVLGAWASVFFTVNYNKKNMDILTSQYQLSMPNTFVNINNNYQSKKNNYISYFLEVDIQNRSTANNSYIRGDLNIFYSENNRKLGLVVSTINCVKYDKKEFYDLPINMIGKSSIKKWFVFEIEDNYIKDKIIESYRFDLYDIHDNRISKNIILMNEENNYD